MNGFFDLYVRGVSSVKRLPAFPSTPPSSAQVGLKIALRKRGEIGAGEEIATPCIHDGFRGFVILFPTFFPMPGYRTIAVSLWVL